jgi:hypothetical protein
VNALPEDNNELTYEPAVIEEVVHNESLVQVWLYVLYIGYAKWFKEYY